jgi:hypothetical protein
VFVINPNSRIEGKVIAYILHPSMFGVPTSIAIIYENATRESPESNLALHDNETPRV